MAEQRYQAVLAVISDGLSIRQVAQDSVMDDTPDEILSGSLSPGRFAESPGA
ncbi:hypothetical protein [Mycobacterium haemophilum]|uniref:hypothetical protein n=1 Tax=Mycobacterium haemophilum TaxID=29311 RepID=UPI000A873F22|nr:hypothetical protein [Mycobacterium haemophilum]MCV7339797.1 hypothetical protein [Mycobacterium haemophilum DSM 44634]